MNLSHGALAVAIWGLLALGQAAAAETELIELTVDFGDGFQKRYTEITARAGFTVFAVLEAASRHPHGIKIASRGNGAFAFVESIDGVANQGGGQDASNWRFYVNDQLAKQGAGVVPAKAGDRVLWKFEAGD